MDNFAFTLKEQDDALLVALTGRIGADTLPQLEKLLQLLVAKRQKKIILDFKDVTAITTYAALSKVIKLLRTKNKLVAMACMTREARTMLIQTGSLASAEVFGTVSDAWKHLSPK